MDFDHLKRRPGNLSGLFVCLLAIPLLLSCFGIRENLKNIQTCKYKILETKMERIDILPFPPVPKMVISSKLEIENPNDTDVRIYAFDLGLYADLGNGKLAELAKVISSEEVLVPALSKNIINPRIETSFENRQNQDKLLLAILVARALLAGKDPNLRIKGIVKYKTFLGEVDLPVDEKVPLLLPKAPEINI
ncbi:hypothetical protein EHQ53_05675 [Leptospira langatensis]|uniref:Uncharacterized protein n=1 Tax=Leptospira langatensis TaxID=2484983 RepID=A0A5F1ZT35_9LEPT|nr:LEA type 2 family protein [Leptospira langatensis]TGK02954.1 hypothetical protein EHO57_06510 [Leptospira langatensis]TGL41709.1 hypothetical protein EHQ53_05675 [Leptospira langatensis]